MIESLTLADLLEDARPIERFALLGPAMGE
jgi:hypothetical protein